MPTHRLRFLSLLPVLLWIVLLDGAWAQSQATTGVIRGLVWDQFSNPIANATVALKETRTNYERTLTCRPIWGCSPRPCCPSASTT